MWDLIVSVLAYFLLLLAKKSFGLLSFSRA